MSTLTLDVPDVLAEYKTDTVRFIAAKLYQSGKLSSGKQRIWPAYPNLHLQRYWVIMTSPLLTIPLLKCLGMPQKYDTVNADTSCFILLDKIGELNLLALLFGEVITTPTIAAEFGKSLPSWVKINAVNDSLRQQLLELEIDKGEASAITLYFESLTALLVLDDAKARKIADKLNLNYTGTLGLILKAKQEGILTQIKPLLQKIQNTNFRFSEKIMKEILTGAGE